MHVCVSSQGTDTAVFAQSIPSVLTPTHVGLRVRCIRQLRIVYQPAIRYLIAAPWPASSRTRAAHSTGPPTSPDARRSPPRACAVLLARRRRHLLQRDRGYKYHWVPARPEHFRCPRHLSLVCLPGVLPCERDLCAAPAHYYRPSLCESPISMISWNSSHSITTEEGLSVRVDGSASYSPSTLRYHCSSSTKLTFCVAE